MSRVRLMLDEMISSSLVERCWEYDVDALPVRNRGLLNASDIKVWRYAQTEQRTVVTANERDFRNLAFGSLHHGLLLIPNGASRDEQFTYIKTAWNYVAQTNVATPTFANKIACVTDSLQVALEDFSRITYSSIRVTNIH